jgi:hypothetical protein
MLGTDNPSAAVNGPQTCQHWDAISLSHAFGQKSAPLRRHSSWIKMKWVYAKSLGRNAKNDRIDARVGARYDG